MQAGFRLSGGDAGKEMLLFPVGLSLCTLSTFILEKFGMIPPYEYIPYKIARWI
jgi:hypothetical protein